MRINDFYSRLIWFISLIDMKYNLIDQSKSVIKAMTPTKQSGEITRERK